MDMAHKAFENFPSVIQGHDCWAGRMNERLSAARTHPLDADGTRMQVVRGRREREQLTNKAFKGSWLQLIN